MHGAYRTMHLGESSKRGGVRKAQHVLCMWLSSST